MTLRDQNAKPPRAEDPEAIEPELRQALDDFRSSVMAWSESMTSRPRGAKVAAPTNWRLLTKWALGSVVFVGTVSGGFYQNYHQNQVAQVEARAAARAAEQQRLIAEQATKEQSAEDLMAKVDSDISREVPSALEPLATLMTDDPTQGN